MRSPGAGTDGVAEGGQPRLFGFLLSREINVIALIALFLSLSSLGWQAWTLYRGPQVELRIGDRVNLLFESNPARPGVLFLKVNARLSYINRGAVGRDAIVTNEILHIFFGERKPYEYRWLHFENLLPDPKDRTAVASDATPAHDFIVPGAGVASHQTTFAAFPEAPLEDKEARAVVLAWPAFLRLVQEDASVEFVFTGIEIGGRQHSRRCRLTVTEEMVEVLDALAWITAHCVREETG
jgi:hypothetical protein